MRLQSIDQFLIQPPQTENLQGFPRFLLEFWYFGIKEVRASLFVGLFFASIFIVPKAGLFGLPRYDVLFLIAILIQAGMVWSKLETMDELKAVTLFHQELISSIGVRCVCLITWAGDSGALQRCAAC